MRKTPDQHPTGSALDVHFLGRRNRRTLRWILGDCRFNLVVWLGNYSRKSPRNDE